MTDDCRKTDNVVSDEAGLDYCLWLQAICYKIYKVFYTRRTRITGLALNNVYYRTIMYG